MRKGQQYRLLATGCVAVLLYPWLQVVTYLFSRKEYRYDNLDSWINKSLKKGDYEKASELAVEWLDLAQRFRGWNYGNAIHNSHQTLGLVALKQGDIEKAKKHLLLAGRTPGSPQLNSFGPRMVLARELVEVGEKDVVIKYLDLIGRFWGKAENGDYIETKTHKRKQRQDLEQWKTEIKEGKVPQHRKWVQN